MFEPIILPKIIWLLPRFAADIEVTNSGSDVPMATRDNPMKESGISSSLDIYTADLTARSTPNRVKDIEIIRIGRLSKIGFLKVKFEKKSFSLEVLTCFLSFENFRLKII